MAARLLFFGLLREMSEGLETAPADVATLGELRAWIVRQAPDVGAALKSAKVRVAIDGEIVHDDALSIVDAHEIAFLPSMSGG